MAAIKSFSKGVALAESSVAFCAASAPCFISASVGGDHSGWKSVIATPQCAMAQVGSFSATAVKRRRASS